MILVAEIWTTRGLILEIYISYWDEKNKVKFIEMKNKIIIISIIVRHNFPIN